MDYIITKDELTSLADAIRRFDGTSGTLSYPNGFESAFDAALPWDFEGQDYDIVGGEGKIAEDTNNMKTMVIDWSSQITTRKYFQNAILKMASFPNATSLGSSTFVKCYQLESVSAPKVTTVDTSFIALTSKLSFISLPECITIETKAFGTATGLKDIYMPKCTTIKSGAFLECPKLSNISGPEVTTIEDGLFRDTSAPSALTGYGLYQAKDIYLPKCDNVSYNALSNACSLGYQGGIIKNLLIGITNLSFPLYSVQNATFPECISITKTQVNNDTLLSLNFSKLSKIPDDCFRACDALTTVIASSCLEIGTSAFLNCKNLKTLDFDSCQKIGEKAFSGAFNNDIYISVNFPKCIEIGEEAFSGCVELRSVGFYSDITDISNTVSVGARAFMNCSWLTTVIPFNVTEGNIPAACFSSCFRLTQINIPNCTNISDGAFYGCSSLSNVSVPYCQLISSNAFRLCSGLKEINVPSCSIFGTYAFAYCSQLSSISYLMGSITEFPNSLFLATGFSRFSDSTILRIGYGCFQRCSILRNINFSECTYISGAAFSSCSMLYTCTIPACEQINGAAFASCSSLRVLALGSNINNISEQAFINCTSLYSLTIGNSSAIVTKKKKNAFSNTPMSGTGSGYIYVPQNLLSSYKTATNWAVYSSHIKAIGT